MTLLPVDPDRSAREIRARLRELVGVDLAVVIARFVRAALALGDRRPGPRNLRISPLADFRGLADTGGREMRDDVVAVADEICAAAELASGRRPAGRWSWSAVLPCRGARVPSSAMS